MNRGFCLLDGSQNVSFLRLDAQGCPGLDESHALTAQAQHLDSRGYEIVLRTVHDALLVRMAAARKIPSADTLLGSLELGVYAVGDKVWAPWQSANAGKFAMVPYKAHIVEAHAEGHYTVCFWGDQTRERVHRSQLSPLLTNEAPPTHRKPPKPRGILPLHAHSGQPASSNYSLAAGLANDAAPDADDQRLGRKRPRKIINAQRKKLRWGPVTEITESDGLAEETVEETVPEATEETAETETTEAA